MSKIKFFIQQSWLLIVAAFCFGLLIAVTNAALDPMIKQNEKDKLNTLMSQLITDANTFEVAVQDAVVEGSKGKQLKTTIYKALDDNGQTVGFAFIAIGPGFADKIKLVIATDRKSEKFFGFKVLASNETPGFGDRIKYDYFQNQFKLAPTGNIELSKVGDAGQIDSRIIAISGATVSSDAVVNIFNTYTDTIKQTLQRQGFIDNGK
ncbi:FMN-binding protein [Planctomycetota bacterium]